MVELWQRLVLALKVRGPKKFIFFILTRFFRQQSDLLFDIDPRIHLDSNPDFGNYRLCIADRNNAADTLDNPLAQQLFLQENILYKPALSDMDQLFFVVDENMQVLHYSYIQYKTLYKKILSETEAVPLITNCFTSPKARGQKLYPKTLRAICHSLAEHGCERVIITCAPDNIPSINGIKQAGFVFAHKIVSFLFLSRIAIQFIRYDDIKIRLRLVWLTSD